MMLKDDIISQNPAKDRGRLVDDRCERDRIDDPVHVPVLHMIQRETERSQRLAATCRHVECEEAARQRRLVAHIGRMSPRNRWRGVSSELRCLAAIVTFKDATIRSS